MNEAEESVALGREPVNLSPENLERFWSKVSKDGPLHPYDPDKGECWMWLSSRRLGYGRWKFRRRNYSSHRVALSLSAAKAPPLHLDVLHSCDNPSCVNPHHLFIGTVQDNMRDMVKKGRHISKVKPWKVARGERCGASKLTSDEVIKIREMFKSGIKVAEISKLFPAVGYGAIHKIAHRLRWTHIH